MLSSLPCLLVWRTPWELIVKRDVEEWLWGDLLESAWAGAICLLARLWLPFPHQGVVVSYTEQQHKRTACPWDGPNRELQSRPRTLPMLKESDGISPEPHTLSVTTNSLLCRSLHNIVTNISSFCCQHTGGNALHTIYRKANLINMKCCSLSWNLNEHHKTEAGFPAQGGSLGNVHSSTCMQDAVPWLPPQAGCPGSPCRPPRRWKKPPYHCPAASLPAYLL